MENKTPREYLQIKNVLTEFNKGTFLRFGMGNYADVCKWLEEYAKQQSDIARKEGFEAARKLENAGKSDWYIKHETYEDYLNSLT